MRVAHRLKDVGGRSGQLSPHHERNGMMAKNSRKSAEAREISRERRDAERARSMGRQQGRLAKRVLTKAGAL